MLAVVLIVVAVGMLLFPPGYRPRNATRRSTCQSNLKQCAQALKMYCDDYNGMMPSSYLIHRSNRWNRQDCIAFCTRLCTGDPKSPVDGYPGAKRATWPQVLCDNMRNKEIMWCPSDPADHRGRDPVVSYWFKPAMDRAWYGCPDPKRTMADYGYESDQVVFFEYSGWHYQDRRGLRAPGDGGNVEVNASFIDTHVKKMTIPACGPPNYINSPSGMTRAYSPSTTTAAWIPVRAPRSPTKRALCRSAPNPAGASTRPRTTTSCSSVLHGRGVRAPAEPLRSL